VKADEIDILVDLAGHTMPLEALFAFALKPAPVQVSWMGVHATTGLTAIDYFLGDAHMPCPGTEHLFSEKVVRLQHAQYCYRPLGDPGLAPSPCFANGHITFGCFNNPRKITREVVKVWSVILHLHRNSKLLLKYAGLDLEMARQRLLQWFAEDGIAADRVVFEDRSRALEYLASFNRIDIALDPFPYNGGTTTLDALWMGVPVVSVRGRLAVNCCGASFLSAVGFPVASTLEQYISLAGDLVKTIPATPGLRQRIRHSLMQSPLMDEPGLMREVEAAYREMWRTWCEQRRIAHKI
jgi:predicted O-linked N-acetylglucosamine transferase (SPINDLY family)